MLKEYPKFKRNEIWKFYDELPNSEKKFFEEYSTYRKARGISAENDVNDVKRYILQLRYILQKDLRNIDLNEVREITAIINTSWLKTEVKNGLKIDFKNFLKFAFPDWSMRFAGLEDIRQNPNSRNEERINAQTIFSQEDIEKMVRHETQMSWKAFILTQYEAGLRTIETRTLKWDDIKFNVDGDISEVNIYSTKTKKARTVFIKEATFYLQKLKEEQHNQGVKSIYVFPSKEPNVPVSKNAVSMWFRELSQKALGRQGWNYLLRHSRATELYRLADENKISKETAIKFMGHSKDMSYTYTHLDKLEIKNMLKNQVYKVEDLPEVKKHELEKTIEELRKISITQQEEIGKLSSEVKELWGMSERIRHVKWLVEAADKSELIQAEFEKYMEGLPSGKKELVLKEVGSQEALKRAKYS